MKLSRLISLASTVLTVKALWWDKLNQTDKDKYVAKAKNLFAKNQEVIADKGKQLADDFKKKQNEAKHAGSETPAKDAVADVADEVPTPAEVFDNKVDAK